MKSLIKFSKIFLLCCLPLVMERALAVSPGDWAGSTTADRGVDNCIQVMNEHHERPHSNTEPQVQVPLAILASDLTRLFTDEFNNENLRNTLIVGKKLELERKLGVKQTQELFKNVQEGLYQKSLRYPPLEDPKTRESHQRIPLKTNIFAPHFYKTLSPHPRDFRSVSILENGQLLIAGLDGDPWLQFYNPDSGATLWQDTSGRHHIRWVHKVRISPKGDLALSNDYSRINVWDLKDLMGTVDSANQSGLVSNLAFLNLKPLMQVENKVNNFNDADFSQDGRHIVTFNAEGRIQVWDPYSGREVASRQTEQKDFVGQGFDVKFLEDNKRILLFPSNEAPEVWSLDGSSTKLKFTHPVAPIKGFKHVTVAPKGDKVFGITYMGSLCVWDGLTGRLVAEGINIKGDGNDVPRSLDLSRDGRWLLIGHEKGLVSLRNSETYELLGQFRVKNQSAAWIGSVQMYKGNTQLLIKLSNGGAEIWNLYSAFSEE